jgi:hypothetical protein
MLASAISQSSLVNLAGVGAASLCVLAGCAGEPPPPPQAPAAAESPRPAAKRVAPTEFVGSGDATLVGPARKAIKAPNVPDQKYASLRIVVKPPEKAADPEEVVIEFDHGPFAGCPVPARREISGLIPRSGEPCDFVYAGRSESRVLEVFVRKVNGDDEIEGQVKADLEDALVTFKFKGKRKP